MKDDRFYLIRVAEDIGRLGKFTIDGKTAFFHSELIQAAVLRHLQTLGESIKRLSLPLWTRYPDLAWRGIISLRNVLVHDYLEVDLEDIWNIFEIDLPVLKNQIQPVLQDVK